MVKSLPLASLYVQFKSSNSLLPSTVLTLAMILPIFISFKKACWKPKKLAVISKLPVLPSKLEFQLTICKQYSTDCPKYPFTDNLNIGYGILKKIL